MHQMKKQIEENIKIMHQNIDNAETVKTIEKAFLEHTPIDTLYEKYGNC